MCTQRNCADAYTCAAIHTSGGSSGAEFRTFEGRVEQVFPSVAQQSTGEHKVESTQQQMIRVHQVVADHGEVPWTRKKTGMTQHELIFMSAGCVGTVDCGSAAAKSTQAGSGQLLYLCETHRRAGIKKDLVSREK